MANLWWMIHKDLISEWRACRAWPAMMVLGAVVALLVSLQMDLLPHHRQRVVGCLLWLAIFFSGMIAVDRSFAGERENDFKGRHVELLAISSETPEDHAASLALGELPFRLLADPDHANARRFHSYDDFEDLELHSTILIDREGRIRWARSGGDPFMDLDFLIA